MKYIEWEINEGWFLIIIDNDQDMLRTSFFLVGIGMNGEWENALTLLTPNWASLKLKVRGGKRFGYFEILRGVW